MMAAHKQVVEAFAALRLATFARPKRVNILAYADLMAAAAPVMDAVRTIVAGGPKVPTAFDVSVSKGQ